MLHGAASYSGVTLYALYEAHTVVGNDFSDDPNCVAVWNMENDALKTDTLLKNKWITDVNVVADPCCVQGLRSARFTRSLNSYMSIPDANLSAGFPMKSTGTQKSITICAWVRLASLPTGGYDTRTILSKEAGYQDYGFSFGVWKYGVTQYVVWKWGQTAYDLYIPPVTFAWTPVVGRWYHITGTYDNTTGMCRIRVYDSETDDVVAADRVAAVGGPIRVNSKPLVIGADARNWLDTRFDGLMDEVVVFNRALTVADIDKVREGTYGQP